MLYILTGTDIFAKERFLKSLASEEKANILQQKNEAIIEMVSSSQTDLFGVKEIKVFENYFSNAEAFEKADQFIQSKQIFVILEQSLDKRKTAVTDLIKNPAVIIKDFNVPSGASLVDWTMAHAKEQEIKIELKAIKTLLELLGLLEESNSAKYSTEAKIDPLQIHNELQKLEVFANNNPISEADVRALVQDQRVPEIWDVIDAIAKKQPAKILSLVQSYLNSELASDEKSKIILLNASLADQLRSLLFYKSSSASGMGESDILKVTGWKSGRLFIVKRNSQAFSELQLVDLLKKLEALDFELKTSSVPPRVMVDLILSQI